MNKLYSTSCALKFKKVTHVLFDLDGLILDSEPLYTKAIQNVVGKFGKTFTKETKVKIMGLTGVDAAKIIVDSLNLPLNWEEYYELAKEQYAIILQEAPLMPDTEVVYKRVFTEIAQKHGKIYTPEIQAKVVGTIDTESARIAVTEMKLPMSPDQFLIQFKSITRQSFVKNIPILPGAERLIRHLHSTNVPIAVATSSGQESFKLKVKNYQELFSLFSHVVTGGSDPDVKRGKPAPDIFLVCASRFKDKPKPEDCLVFEDSPNGVTAAISAGMQAVMVPDKEMDEKLCQHATLKLNSLVDLKPELFGLPEFSN